MTLKLLICMFERDNLIDLGLNFQIEINANDIQHYDSPDSTRR